MTEQPSRLDEIRARLAATTDEKWHKYQISVRSPPSMFAVGRSPYGRLFNESDAEFIVHCREDIALLLAVVEAYLNNLTHEESVEEAVVTMRVAGHGELADAWGELV